MLAEGEIIQLSLKQKIPSFQEHIDIISNKTAALFASGCACGAILNNANSDIIQSAYDFGFNFGISFQLIDDILDYQGNDALGKKIGTDFFEGKFTLPLILAYNSAQTDDKNFIKSVMLKKTQRSDDDFEQIKTIITKLDTIAQSRAVAKEYIIYAEKSLDVFDKKTPVYNALKDVIIKNLHRHL
jgi:octaprenyl-diphosphate synthase